MEPIINPIILYWLSIVNTIKIITIISTMLLGSGIIALLMYSWLEEKLDLIKKHIKKFIIPFCIGLIACIAIPSSQTLKQMIVVSYITPNNIAATGETVDKTIDYIIEKVDKIMNHKDED